MRPSLVFLPGTLCDARVWEESAQLLSRYGACQHVDYGAADSIAAMAADVLRAFPGPLLPIGSSMGGIVALEMARQAPERLSGIALFGVNPGPDTAERAVSRDAQLRYARQQGIGALVRDLLAPFWFTSDCAHYPELEGAAVAMAERLGIPILEAQFEALAGRSDSWSLLPELRIPALVAYGEADRVCPGPLQEDMAALLRHVRLEGIEDAGHLAPMEQAAACAALLADWIGGEGLMENNGGEGAQIHLR